MMHKKLLTKPFLMAMAFWSLLWALVSICYNLTKILAAYTWLATICLYHGTKLTYHYCIKGFIWIKQKKAGVN